MYDIFRNPQLKSIMMIYLMMMGFDLFGRYMIPGSGAVAPADSAAPGGIKGPSATIVNENGQTQAITEENGDAIPIDRTYLGEPHTIDDKSILSAQI